MKKSKIFFVSPAFYPFVKYGRSAEFSSSLPSHLQALGHEVRVLMPKYGSINERKHIIRDIIRMREITVHMRDEDIPVAVKSGFIPETKTQIYFAECEKYFKRQGLFHDPRSGEPYKDNDERFIFLAKIAIETLKTLGWQPDIIHCCDWQTGALPAMIHEEQKRSNFFKKTAVAFSLIQTDEGGFVDKSAFEKMFTKDEQYDKNDFIIKNKFSFLKAAITHADAVTVPFTHKRWKTITKPTSDIETIIAGAKLMTDIEFGAEHNYWSPSNNALDKPYTFEKLERRAVNRENFLKDRRTGLDHEAFILGIVAENLAVQHKEIASYLKALKDIPLQILILGDETISAYATLKSIVGKNPNHKICTLTDPEEHARHFFYAAADVFVIPKTENYADIHYLHGVHYGSIPLISDDSHFAERLDPLKEKTGYALVYTDEKDFVKKVQTALDIYSDKERWQNHVQRAMKADLSWDNYTTPIVKLYEKILSKLR